MMALKLKQWAGRYALVWIALVLIVAGLVAGAFGPRTQPVAAIVTLVGTVALAVWLARQPLWNRRSLEAGGNALIKILALVVILAAVNFLAVQSGLQVDLTGAQRFSLAPESKKLVQGLQQPVEVLIFDKQINAEARQLLELYQRENPKFQFRVVDPQSDPATAQKFEVRGFGEVHLESQGRQERLREALSESSLANALVRLTQPSQGKVVYVQGHGERPAEPGQRGYSQAIQALEGRNFTLQPQVLAETPNLPQGTKVVVVAGPQRPWLAA
ncbi:MAG: Gldg family protein, partial [Gloeomargaritaceae cyanobacterium C42_A2020_066]|nr:Gldg family protein [Gloeomargaritaceae cyanobacterium C42_A2020_066]